MGRRWCDHVEPATATVECGGAHHRLSWRRGHMVVEDHDLGAERTMRALGAETPTCLRILTQWRQLHTWATSTELFAQMRSRLGDEQLLGPGDLRTPHELALLLTWERAWHMSSYFGEGHERLLQAQLQARALEPVRRHVGMWADRLGCRQSPSVQVKILRPGQEPRVVGAIDRFTARATAAFGVRWVLEVWARGLALVDDALVLKLAPSPRALRASAVRWEPRASGEARPEVASITLGRRPDGSWARTWDG